MLLPGYIRVELTAADPAAVLTAITNAGIHIQNVKNHDGFIFSLTTNSQDYKKICEIAEKKGAQTQKKNTFGFFLIFASLLKRPVLTAFILLLLLFTCLIPSRIYFISIEGNSTIPDNYILDVAAECGIGFGTKRRSIRSEQIKNQLLKKIPELQWAGINTNGCVATISVREKVIAKEPQKAQNQVASIVAAQDGIIQSCTVLQGTSLCKVGQVVKAGQLLVSGYLDCGIITQTTQAKAEIFALTARRVEAIALSPRMVRTAYTDTKTTYSLRVGKKLINFHNYSGNLDATCGKIYSEKYIRLPGGFYLPIALVKETEIHYQTAQDKTITPSEKWLTNAAKGYLKSTMISGTIISEEIEVAQISDVLCLRGKFSCIEMIGQTRYEQTIPKDDKQ